jgi:hypothetical protein
MYDLLHLFFLHLEFSIIEVYKNQFFVVGLCSAIFYFHLFVGGKWCPSGSAWLTGYQRPCVPTFSISPFLSLYFGGP